MPTKLDAVLRFTVGARELLGTCLSVEFTAAWDEWKRQESEFEVERIRRNKMSREELQQLQLPGLNYPMEPTLKIPQLDKSIRFRELGRIFCEHFSVPPDVAKQLYFQRYTISQLTGTIDQYRMAELEVVVQVAKDHVEFLEQEGLECGLWSFIGSRAQLDYLILHPPAEPSEKHDAKVAELTELASETLEVVQEHISLLQRSDVFVYKGAPTLNEDRELPDDPSSVRAWYKLYLIALHAKYVREAETLKPSIDFSVIEEKLTLRKPLSAPLTPSQRDLMSRSLANPPRDFLQDESIGGTYFVRMKLWDLFKEEERDIFRVRTWEAWKQKLPSEEAAVPDEKLEEYRKEDEDKLRFFSVELDRSSDPHASITTTTHWSSSNPGNTDRWFVVTSGELVWGHIQCVLKGAHLVEGNADEYSPGLHDNNSDQPAPALPGGTILQRSLRYRCAARNGHWKVRRVYSLGGDMGISVENTIGGHVGWIMCHEDYDPLEVVYRVSATGYSLGNDQIDRDVRHINRYDWSHDAAVSAQSMAKYLHENLHYQIRTDIPSHYYTDDNAGSFWSGYTLALDALAVDPSFTASFFRTCIPSGYSEYRSDSWAGTLFERNGDNFGAYLQQEGTEYEFGALVFSGTKHSQFPESDELIGYFYGSGLNLLCHTE
ncbi:hypothetical protein BJ742DRAFT_738926 [Cladochytrium replicatum]|nr:hypothetical protein BJ742DRAFT_738926 [Cladochytrium replicatum]